MPRDLDSFLLDRVFQPLANAAADRISCFGLARAALYGAVALQTAVLAWSLARMGDPQRSNMIVLGTLAEYAAAQMVRGQIGRAERQSRPGALNLARVTHRPLRLLWVAFAAGAVALFLGSGLRPVDCLHVSVGLLWVLALYFMGCAALPPRRQARAPRPAWATGAA